MISISHKHRKKSGGAVWCSATVSAIDRGFEPRSGQAKDYNIGCFFWFFYSNIFLFKMLVTFLLQKPKLLMKYFILIFPYLIQYCFYQTVVVVLVVHVLVYPKGFYMQ